MASVHPTITADKLEYAVKRRLFSLDDPGFCVACGHVQSTETDASRDVCKKCRRAAVWSAEMILMCNMVSV